MTLLYKGKTKDLMQDDQGNVYFHFKDDVTGTDGKFDPGANQVGATMEGSGKANIILSTYFFEKMAEQGIPTHFISSDAENNTMQVKKANLFGHGLEVICRYRAVGSFIRRYGLYAKSGDLLDEYVEFTLKDDDREDPLINEDALVQLGLLKENEAAEIKELTQKISNIIKEELAQKGLELYDIKLEFGRLENSDEIVLIDEVSGGNMRVYKEDAYIEPLDLVHYFQ
ncbi:MAG TPA: phosphoribosylaminoimidazolesuccinocarboxamide synthase [Atopostipes sp.]|nr:phosphoribosylaminoimidazolesuccinocarboxamide synthase [Atopostipes sp.]